MIYIRPNCWSITRITRPIFVAAAKVGGGTLALILVGALLSSPATAEPNRTPEAVAKEFVELVFAGDRRALSFWAGPDATGLEQTLGEAGRDEKIDVSGLVYRLIERKGDQARVRLSGPVSLVESGVRKKGTLDETIELKNVQGEWKVVKAFLAPERQVVIRMYDTQAEVTLRNLETAQEMYYLDHARYAPDLSTLRDHLAAPPAEIVLTITRGDSQGWRAEARHARSPNTLVWDSAKGGLQKKP